MPFQGNTTLYTGLDGALSTTPSGLIVGWAANAKTFRRSIDSAWRAFREMFPDDPTYDAEARRWVELTLFAALAIDPSREEATRQGLVASFGFQTKCEERSLSQCSQSLERWIPVSLLELASRDISSVHVNVFLKALESLDPFFLMVGAPEVWASVLLESHQRMLTLRKSGARTNASRKRTGTYYTPVCVAEYLIDRASPTSTVWDPACGGGVFLLATARRLLRKGFLPDHVLRLLYGTDLDPDATLLCRRLLWLSMRSLARDEAEAYAWADLLQEHIVAKDALADEPPPGFPAAFSTVVGNPPYRKERGDRSSRQTVSESHLGQRYRTARMDYWYYFVHRGLERLKSGGRLAFIVDSYWTSSSSSRRLVEHIREASVPEELFFLGDLPVFPGVSGRHMMMTLRKKDASPSQDYDLKDNAVRIVRVSSSEEEGKKKSATLLEDVLKLGIACEIQTKRLGSVFHENRLDLTEDVPSSGIWSQGSADRELIVKLGTLGRVRQGIVENPASISPRMLERLPHEKACIFRPGQGVFVLTEEGFRSLDLSEEERRVVRPYHAPCDLGRYYAASRPSHYLIYSTAETWPDDRDYPALLRHLRPFREFMETRRETRQGRRSWRHLHWPRDPELWTSSKIVLPQMGKRPASVPLRGESYVPFNCNVFVPDPTTQESLEYFAALINSRLLGDWFQQNAKHRGVGLDISVRVLSETPVRRVRFDCGEERLLHDRIVDAVQEIMRLKREGGSDLQIDQHEETIDASVEELYVSLCL